LFKDERMEKRLQKSFVMVTVMAAVAAIIALAALIIVSNRYSYALTQYGFSQGDIGNAMAAFADARSSTRTVIAYSNKELVSKNLTAHYDNKAKFQEYFEKMQDTLSTKHEEDAYKQLSQKMEEYWILDAEIIELGKSTANMQNRSRAQDNAAN